MLSTEDFARNLLAHPEQYVGDPAAGVASVPPAGHLAGLALKAFFTRVAPSWDAALRDGYGILPAAERPVFERDAIREAQKPHRDGCSIKEYAGQLEAAEVSAYFVHLFQQIQSKWQHKLDKYDLWHGHVFVGLGDTGVFILFHAKEYPGDLLETGLTDSQGHTTRGEFSKNDPAFKYRNILFSATSHTLYRLDANKGSGDGLKLRQGAAVASTDFADCMPADNSSMVFKRLIFPCQAAPLAQIAAFDTVTRQTLASALESLTVPEEFLGLTRGMIYIDWPEGHEPRVYFKATQRSSHHWVQLDDDYRVTNSQL